MANQPHAATPRRKNRRLIYLLTLAQRRLQGWMQSGSGGGSATQAGVLFALGQKDGMPIGDVAKAIGLGASAMSGLADRMEGASLVERRRDPNDGRGACLYLTEAGELSRLAAAARAAEISKRLAEGFSEAELDIVVRWLTSVGEKFPKEQDK